MEKTLKLLTLLGKVVGLLAAIDITPISPKFGAILFFASSLAKDTINRVGDFLDNGKADNSFGSTQ